MEKKLVYIGKREGIEIRLPVFYLELSEQDDILPEGVAFKKPLGEIDYSVGSVILADKKDEQYSFKAFLYHYPDTEKVSEWQTEHYAAIEANRQASSQKKLQQNEPLMDLLNQLHDAVAQMPYSKRRALLALVIDKVMK